MNKTRREQIQKVIDTIGDIKQTIDDICSDEQDYYDNMPEGLQESERGQTAEGAISALESASDVLDDAISNLEDAQA